MVGWIVGSSWSKEKCEEKIFTKVLKNVMNKKSEHKLWAENRQKFVNKSFNRICEKVTNKSQNNKI